MSFFFNESEGTCQLVLELICPDGNDYKKGPICGDTSSGVVKLCVSMHVPVPVTVAVVGDATVDRRGSHHRHNGLPAQRGRVEGEGARN